MDSSSVTLKPVGDVELWYAEGEGRAWRLPMHVEWKQRPGTDEMFALVLPGVSFYEMQLLAVRALLNGYALDEREDRWLIPRERIRDKLAKAPGINAAFYYHWPDGIHAPIPAPYHPMTMSARAPLLKVDEHREFADFVAQERGIPSDAVIAVLGAIAQLAPKWMLERRETLNLGFCKLAALPFRSNWKEIVCYKLKTQPLLKILNQARALRARLLDSIGLPQTLTSTHNVGLRMKGNHDFRLNYTLEAVPTAKFERVAEEVERKRMQPGQTSYVGHYEWSVKKHYDFIVEALLHYLKKNWAPWASVRVSRTTGVLSFFPRRRYTGKLDYGADLENIPVHIVPPDARFSVFAGDPGASDPQLLHPEVAALPEMPAVPSPSDDVRQCTVLRDVDEPRPNGTVRLSVLDASQGDAPGGGGRGLLPGESTTGGKSSRMEAS